jgi:TIR domain
MAESAAVSAGRIFISYRRDDTAYPAGWLYDQLEDHFGAAQIFKDVDSIELGDDFARVIKRAVGSCDVLLALIGDQWLTVTDDRGRQRLDDPNDFVRLEIKTALTRKIRVIPILIDGATMPRADQLPSSLARLVRYQALELSSNRFDRDVADLLNALDKHFKHLSELQNARPLAAMQGQPIPTSPATAKPGLPGHDGVMEVMSYDELMDFMSPTERAALEKIENPDQRASQAREWYLQKQSLLAKTLSNLAQMRHDMRKAVAQNLRET